MNKRLKRAIVISPQGFGDLVMILPIMGLLEKCKIEFDIIISSENKKTFLDFLNVKYKNLFYIDSSSFLILIKHLIKIRFIYYDYIFINATVSKYKFIPFLLTSIINLFNFRIIFKYILNNNKIINHLMIENLKQISFNNLNSNYTIPMLLGDYKSAIHLKIADKAIEENDFIIIAPGSGIQEASKRWPVCNYAELINMIISKNPNMYVHIIGDSNEAELIKQIAQLIYSSYPNSRPFLKLYPGLLSWEDLFSQISKAKLLIANCNGFTHLASLMDIKILGLYGPTNSVITGPYSSNFRAVKLGLNCSPCYTYHEKPPIKCEAPACMQQLSPSLVFDAVESILRS